MCSTHYSKLRKHARGMTTECNTRTQSSEITVWNHRILASSYAYLRILPLTFNYSAEITVAITKINLVQKNQPVSYPSKTSGLVQLTRWRSRPCTSSFLSCSVTVQTMRGGPLNDRFVAVTSLVQINVCLRVAPPSALDYDHFIMPRAKANWTTFVCVCVIMPRAELRRHNKVDHSLSMPVPPTHVSLHWSEN